MMTARPLPQLAKAQALLIWQQTEYRWLWLWLPMMLLAWISWIFAQGPVTDLPVLVIDHDQSSSSRQLLRLMDASPGIQLEAWPHSLASAEQQIRQHQAYALLQIESGFEQRLLRQEDNPITLWHNAQWSTHSGQIERDLVQASLSFNQLIESKSAQAAGQPQTFAEQLSSPIQVHSLALHNPSMQFHTFLQVPMSLAILQLLCLLFVLQDLGNEIRGGQLLARRRWSGLKPMRYLQAKIMLYVCWSVLLTSLYLGLLSHGLADFQLSLALWLVTLLLAVSGVGIGLLFLGVTLSQRFSLSATGFYVAPAFAFAGQAFPLTSMPLAAQAWAALMPLTHWLVLYNQMGVAQLNWWQQGGALLWLALLAVAPLYLGWWLLGRRAFQANALGKR